MPGPLDGLRILDLSRVLAGPTCTQILGDLGADVIKIERPGAGDDTRKWGPPYIQDADGADTTESAYYASANRNKRSLAIDIAKPAGQALVRRLLGRCEVLIENFKVGDLARYGLAWEQLKDDFPGLVYCSITGFGQSGPYARRAGYDYLAQAMSGAMSITGQTEGAPTKTGVAIADIMAGQYAVIGILAALRHRDLTGEGQRVDIGLLDCQLAALSYVAQNYLVNGRTPARWGNAHPTIVPYDTFHAADGWMVLAVGNDTQFRRFCEVAGRPELGADPRFATNDARVRNREALYAEIAPLLHARAASDWLAGLEAAGVPSCAVNTVPETFADPQVRHREMRVEMAHPLSPDPLAVVGSPLKLSATPVGYRLAPPTLGQHTDDLLAELLGMGGDEIAALRSESVI